jgi:hypothetical protein
MYIPIRGLQSAEEPGHNGELYQMSYIPIVLEHLTSDTQLGRRT